MSFVPDEAQKVEIAHATVFLSAYVELRVDGTVAPFEELSWECPKRIRPRLNTYFSTDVGQRWLPQVFERENLLYVE